MSKKLQRIVPKHSRRFYFAVIVVAVILSVLMIVIPSLNKLFIGLFGYAGYGYICAVIVTNIFFMMGKRISISRSKSILYLTFFLAFVSTLHIVFTKDIIALGFGNYITEPFFQDSVGGTIISLATSIIVLPLGYTISLVIFFILTATLGLINLYPLLLTQNSKPKVVKTSQEFPQNYEDNKANQPTLLVEKLDSAIIKEKDEDVYSFSGEINYQNTAIEEPKLDCIQFGDYSDNQLFGVLKTTEQRNAERVKASGDILFSKHNNKENKEPNPNFAILQNITDIKAQKKEEPTFVYEQKSSVFEEKFGAPLQAEQYFGNYKSKVMPKMETKTQTEDLDFEYPLADKNATSSAYSYSQQKRDSVDSIYQDADIYEKPKREFKNEQVNLQHQEEKPTVFNEIKFEPKQKVTQEAPKVVSASISYANSNLPKVVCGSGTRPFKFPPIDMLRHANVRASDEVEDYQFYKERLEDTLMEFGVPAEVVGACRGPSFSRYELKLAPGIPVKRISSLSENLMMRLKVRAIRILAPIVGKDAVGVEIPNNTREIVSLRSMIASRAFNLPKEGIQLALGKSLEGESYVTDLVSLPHLLIAGATNTGKSKCINAIIMSILYKYSPDDVRLMLIDPKRVEFKQYVGLPNLLIKDTICEPQQALNALKWLTEEMDRRYEFLSQLNCVKIEEYMDMCKQNTTLPHLTRIVLIIDEVADLMVKSKGIVEEYIVRLCQLARAAGIYVIVATQRPTVNVITGLIKSNILARIAFTVKTAQDSRIILDEMGAETLLGLGDMLFSFKNDLIRLQGALVSSEEVKEVVEFIKQNNGGVYDEDITKTIMTIEKPEQIVTTTKSSAESGESDDFENILKRVLRVFIQEEKATVSCAQARVGVGYIKAVKIVNELQARGHISAQEGTKPRQVLITTEEFEAIYGK